MIESLPLLLALNSQAHAENNVNPGKFFDILIEIHKDVGLACNNIGVLPKTVGKLDEPSGPYYQVKHTGSHLVYSLRGDAVFMGFQVPNQEAKECVGIASSDSVMMRTPVSWGCIVQIKHMKKSSSSEDWPLFSTLDLVCNEESR